MCLSFHQSSSSSLEVSSSFFSLCPSFIDLLKSFLCFIFCFTQASFFKHGEIPYNNSFYLSLKFVDHHSSSTYTCGSSFQLTCHYSHGGKTIPYSMVIHATTHFVFTLGKIMPISSFWGFIFPSKLTPTSTSMQLLAASTTTQPVNGCLTHLVCIHNSLGVFLSTLQGLHPFFFMEISIADSTPYSPLRRLHQSSIGTTPYSILSLSPTLHFYIDTLQGGFTICLSLCNC